MVQIIKKGQLPKEKEYQTTCSKCGTVFKFKQGEAEHQSDFRDGDYLKIVCPLENCGRLCTVSIR